MGKVCSFIALAMILALANSFLGNARDPDILKDFLIPTGLDPSNITSQFFTYTGFRELVNVNTTGKTAAIETKASMKEFPALEGQAVSIAALTYPPSGINPPHVHPRAAELLIVLQGVLEVGANAGTVSLPNTVFASGISAEILAKAFKTDLETISKLIAANNITKAA
ncbi:hypothetical protein GH714_030947 [Hevea brasiliensis]|uniref:Cupin type-1 domain-containing protein n=1 Tax=Hevea brasiliensis TaxID=3981 RepID=A0A6A6LFY8_HEVBR|nr:hypothetical protein GH714_030947 [Hevea brasiliensis]